MCSSHVPRVLLVVEPSRPRNAASEKIRAAPPRGHPCDAAGVRLVKPLLGAARGAASSATVGSIGRISTGFVKLCSPVVNASARASPGRH